MGAVTTKISVKYAGADWLKSRIDSRGYELSSFGVKVANVLGQVYQGIYHIDDAVLRTKTLSAWSHSMVIPITIYGQLATFDFSHLTFLVFCCQKAGIGVAIHGSFKGYTKLVFTANRSSIGEVLDVPSDEVLAPTSKDPQEDFLGFSDRFTHVKNERKPLFQYTHHEAYSVEPIGWQSLQVLINECHKYRIRASLEGRSPYSLEVQFSKRQTEGSMSQRHPSIEEHRDLLEKYINIDYGSLN